MPQQDFAAASILEHKEQARGNSCLPTRIIMNWWEPDLLGHLLWQHWSPSCKSTTPTNLLPSFRFTWLDDGTKHFRVNSFLTVTKFKSILEEYFNECNNYRNPIQPSPGIFSSWEVSKEVASSLECQEVNFLQEKLVRGNLSFSSKSGNRQKLIDNSFPGWAFPFSRRKNDRLRFLSWLKREITWNSQWCDAIKENLGLKK